MTTLSLCGSHLTDSESRVSSIRLFNNEAVLCEFSNVFAGVCISDFGSFVRIEPDFAHSAFEDSGSQTFLCGKVDPVLA
jgi:hypothetical protein